MIQSPIVFLSICSACFMAGQNWTFYDWTVYPYLPKLCILIYRNLGILIYQFLCIVIYRSQVKRKIIPAIDLSDYKIPEEETDAIYLTYEEIGRVYNLDLSEQPELEPYRRWFVLACLTGLRFSDFSALRPEDLQQDMLYKKQQKSEHWVVIPLRKEAKEIITDQFKAELPYICNSDFNKRIKELAKMAGICQT